MQGNNELILKSTQIAVKDGENEELAKRMRALEEVVNFENKTGLSVQACYLKHVSIGGGLQASPLEKTIACELTITV